MPDIEIEGLTKIYKRGFFGSRHKALDGLSLSVEKGEIFGFLGPNGAGKSTTFKILMGLTSATSGTARVLGKNVLARGARRPVGFLPEDAYFYSYLTARELLRFYGRLQGLAVRQIRAKEDALLARVGLTGAENVRLGEYSKGMRQRFGIAQAMISDPRVLFLDEPLTGLDPLGRKALKDLILELRADGKTIFFSSHILSDAEAICDRVAIIIRGRLSACGPIRNLLSGVGESFDLAVEGIDGEELGARGFEIIRTEGAMAWIRIPSGTDPDPVIGDIRAAGGAVRALIPYRESLESYFVHAADGSGTQAGGAA